MSNAIEFTINVIGESTGERWTGTFKARPRLSHRLELAMNQRFRELLGKDPEHASERAITQADVFSQLSAHLTEWPKWWAEMGFGLDLEDDNVVAEIFDNIVRIRKEANEALKKRAEDAQAEIKKIDPETVTDQK